MGKPRKKCTCTEHAEEWYNHNKCAICDKKTKKKKLKWKVNAALFSHTDII